MTKDEVEEQAQFCEAVAESDDIRGHLATAKGHRTSAAILRTLAEESERLKQTPHVSGYVSLDQFDAAEARAIAAERKAETMREALAAFPKAHPDEDIFEWQHRVVEWREQQT